MNILTKLKSLSLTGKDFFYLIIIGVLSVFLIRDLNKVDGNIFINKPLIESTKNTIDKNGVTHSVIEQKLYTSDEMKSLTDSIRRSEKLTKIVTVTNVITKIDTIIKEVPITIDSITHSITAVKHDKYLDVIFNGNTLTKKGDFTIQFKSDTLTLVNGLKTHWFKSDEHIINLQHSNKYFNITSGNSYTYKDRRNLVVIGPSVGISMGLNNGRVNVIPAIGISMTIPIFTIKSK